MIITINELDFDPNPTVELMIKVMRNVNRSEDPFNIPITCAYPIGKANSHPKS